MKKQGKRTRSQFDVESVPLILGKDATYEHMLRITKNGKYGMAATEIPTRHGFVIMNHVMFPDPSACSTRFIFIANGRLYIGQVDGPGAFARADRIAGRFAAACLQLKAQDVYGARGIL